MQKTLFGILLLAALAGCKEEAAPVADVRPVKTVVVASDAAQAGSAEEFSGEIRARHEVPLSFRIGGKLIERKVNLGAAVATGEVLARLDPGDVALSATAAQAQVQSAKAQLAQAELDEKRARDLLAQHFVSQAEVDRRQTALTAAREQLRQANAQAQLAQNQAGYATLVSPFAGVITATQAEPGAVLGAGQPVLVLARDGEREAWVDVPENRVQGWQPGKKVKVALWADAGSLLDGTVREVAPAADSAARTYRVKVSLPEDARIKMGMTVKVMTDSGNAAIQQTVSLPATALLGTGQTQMVWRVKAQHGQQIVQGQKVAVEAIAGESVQVAGLNAGDVVVVAGVHFLREGQQVRLGEAQ